MITPFRAEELLYPFIQDGKWGYINSVGAWVIKPQYDRCIEMFEGDRVRVWKGKNWGYIDRTGKWVVDPCFTVPCLGNGGYEFEIVSIGKKQGILARSGQLVLPVKYDEIVIFGDRAWVRSGEKLGLASLDGRWILKPSLDWPHGREMPTPTDGGVSWFKRGKKCGLLSRDGKVLFAPQFDEHLMGRKEAEDWVHPEGLDFKNGRAWVMADKECWLITDKGNVLARQPFDEVRAWNDGLYVFTTKSGAEGLISSEGDVVLAARFSEIKPLREGMAVVVQRVDRKTQNGETNTFWTYGYIDERGHVVVEPGVYCGPGSGGQTELAPFAEGLAPVWNNSPEGSRTQTSDSRAGYIDRTGALVIPEQFYRTKPFSDGLGEVGEKIQGRSSNYYYDYQWGYVDKTGACVISPQFGWTTPFCRERAWVLKSGCDPQKPYWAMIDRTGKALTDFAFEPPKSRWFSDNEDNFQKSRWLGDLALISRGDFHNGLATADGKILVEPIFNHINEFHDSVAVAVESRGRDEKGNVKFVTALITERGEILANDKYTAVCDFDGGVAWASHRWTDHHGPYQNEGWGLIDTSARELCELKYVGAHWVWGKGDRYTSNRCPVFYGELAPVALADGFQPSGDKAWLLNSWGYMNREGKIIAWHDKETAR